MSDQGHTAPGTCSFRDPAILDHFIKSADEDQLLAALNGVDGGMLLSWISEPNKQCLFLVAAGRHQWRVLRRMVELGQDPFVRDFADDTALTMALLLHERDAAAERETVSYLLSLGLAKARGAQNLTLPLVYSLLQRPWLSDSAFTWLRRAVHHGLDLAFIDPFTHISELGFLATERMDNELCLLVEGDWLDLDTVARLHGEIQAILHPGDNDNRLSFARAAIDRRLLQAQTPAALEVSGARRI